MVIGSPRLVKVVGGWVSSAVVEAVLGDAAAGRAELAESAGSAEPDVDGSRAEEALAARQQAVRVVGAGARHALGCNDFDGLRAGAHRLRVGRCFRR